MGQYYQAVIGRKYGNDYNFSVYSPTAGYKLMEHAYFGDELVETIAFELYRVRNHYVAWVGDYAATSSKRLAKFIEAGQDRATDFAILTIDESYSKTKMFINHTKKEYFIPKFGEYKYVDLETHEECELDIIIHPLPILTAMGNGNGGGDYDGINMDMVGRWACDEIEVDDPIDGLNKVNGYKDISLRAIFSEDV